MVATVPGAPKTSRTTRLGLNGTMSLAAPLGVETTSSEPKMPFRRYTAKPRDRDDEERHQNHPPSHQPVSDRKPPHP